MFINCDLVKEAGIACEAPATWDDMYAMAKAINDNTEAAGVGLAGKDFDNTMHQFLNYLYSNGGVVIDPATGANKLDSVNTRETLAFYKKLAAVAQEGPTAWERSQIKDLYNDGKIGMYIDGPWGRGQHKDDINEITVPVPAGPRGKNGTLLITDSIVVFRGSGNEALAHDLAKMLTTGESQYSLDTEWGLSPIFDYAKLGFDKPYYENDPYWQAFVHSIGKGGPEPLVDDFKSLQSVFTNMIQGILLASDTVDNLVTIAAEELDEAL
jgi:multiple sugar transport system substrate-binding protein